jgi:cellulose synthase/poly-beta-1,6-N-acetylglucosamine synthase-like glycosyltransferase
MHFWGPAGSAYEKFLRTGNISYLYEMDSFDKAIVTAYFIVLSILSFYGIHRYLMVYLYRRHGKNVPVPGAHFESLPRVTVQIPSYNEMYVIERVIDAVCALEYPRDLLDIQVLDDSTDETRVIADNAVRRWRSLGVDVTLIHRADRAGFKAGALENGLRTAKGEYIAIFDADFVPGADFLQRTIHFFSDPKVGMVQARWEHLNREYSFLTRAQAIFLDGHFMLESYTRSASGRFFNFNGTAGILRRATIEDAGGWEHDTLTEDLDLSYRAQMRGWKFIFLPDVTVPAELPVEINSFKAQQCRWAKGAMQTCRKTLPRLLRGDFNPAEKLEAWYHLTGNISYPLMVVLTLLLFPAMIVRYNQGWFELVTIDLPLFMLSFSSVTTFYLTSQRILSRNWYRQVLYLPGLMALGIGMMISGTKVVLEGALGIHSPFVRTPKYSVEGSSGDWKAKKYRGRVSVLALIELAFGFYFCFAVYYALSLGIYGVVPFLLLFLWGFMYMGVLSLLQGCKGLNLGEPLVRLLDFARLRFTHSETGYEIPKLNQH